MSDKHAVSSKSPEFEHLKAYLVKSAGKTHYINYKVQDIFRIERRGERDRFNQSAYSTINNSDRRLLWHGSRSTNYGGILSQGLRIAPPEAPVSGYMYVSTLCPHRKVFLTLDRFGKGVYLADISTKSANYCCHHSSGGTALLLLCEVELGAPPLKLKNADSNAGEVAKKQGFLSTWGVGSTAPKAWMDAGCVHEDLKGVKMPDVVSAEPEDVEEEDAYLLYNEYIVYDVSQVKLRYLLRVSM